jgi:hypothetical protein
LKKRRMNTDSIYPPAGIVSFADDSVTLNDTVFRDGIDVISPWATTSESTGLKTIIIAAWYVSTVIDNECHDET